VIGVEQQAAVGMVGKRDELAAHLQPVEDVMRRIEFERETQPVRFRDLATLPEIGGGLAQRGRRILSGRDHDQVATQGDRVGAGIFEDFQQALLFLALSEDQAVFGAHARNLESALADEVEHLGIGHAFFEAARKVEAPQLDGVPAGVLCGAQRVGERRRIERPGVQREPVLHLRHCFPPCRALWIV